MTKGPAGAHEHSAPRKHRPGSKQGKLLRRRSTHRQGGVGAGAGRRDGVRHCGQHPAYVISSPASLEWQASSVRTAGAFIHAHSARQFSLSLS